MNAGARVDTDLTGVADSGVHTPLAEAPPPPTLRGSPAGDEAAGFHDIVLARLCQDRAHGIPADLDIPDGKKFVHYCPACRLKSVAFGRMVST